MKKKRKNTNRPNFHKGSQSHIPSQTIGGAKVQIISQNAIQNLKNLSQKYKGINDPRGFLTDLRNALGLPDSQGASKYGVITIPKDDGTFLEVSLRITNHQANANTYIEHNANYEYNLSIVIKKQRRRNTFIPNDNVKLDEYVYYGDNLQKIENPLSKIAEGLIGYLQNGTYEDKTGVGLPNVSPKPQNNQENINCNRNMNKNRIRLTEKQLHRVIKESVKHVLMESDKHQKDYQEFVHLFNGLTFNEAIQKADELGLSYGASNPSNSNDTLDINYKSILGSIYFRGEVSKSYEQYDEDGQFVQLH